MKLLKNILLFALLTTASWSGVSMEIQNVDTDAGTLDIYMTNQPDCSYCEDLIYNNTNNSWPDQKELCETNESTWTVESQISEEECAAIPSITETGGWYFDGIVKGFQFELFGMTLTGISGGLADEYLDYVSYSVATSVILGSSFGSSIIPAGEGVLTQVSFSDYEGDDICFGEDTGSPGSTVISDANGGYIAADWGDCYCGTSDCVQDCAGEWGGDAEEDECGVCDTDSSNDCEQDCAGEWGRSAVVNECGECSGDGSNYTSNTLSLEDNGDGTWNVNYSRFHHHYLQD
jgi:hypothetical protein